MIVATKYKLTYLLFVLTSFFLGFKFLPESIATDSDLYLTGLFLAIYFIALPVFYWVGVMTKGKQQSWKILIALSLSCVLARYSLPSDLSQYFDFIAWVRYPIVAMLIVLELYIFYLVVKGLWDARKAKGDPRLTALALYQNQTANDDSQASDSHYQKLKQKLNDSKNEGLKTASITLASEPASWYYAVPYFSRNHISSIGQINSVMGRFYHVALISAALIGVSVASLIWLADSYEYFAYFIAVIALYSLVFVIGNYRAARHFSTYIQDDYLVVNQGLWSISRFKLADIKSITVNENIPAKDELTIGMVKEKTVKIEFTEPQTYFGLLGTLPEDIEAISLGVAEPDNFARTVEQQAA